MAFVSLAYPCLTPDDARFIEEFRQVHDRAMVGVVAAHWTMIFPVAGVEAASLKTHLAAVARKWPVIPFVCRYLHLHADRLTDNYYLFLVPDEGSSSICRLHDELYTGLMAPHLRLDLPFVPHIGIGTGKDPASLQKVAVEWNGRPRAVAGRITALTLSTYDGSKVRDQASFPLQGAD